MARDIGGAPDSAAPGSPAPKSPAPDGLVPDPSAPSDPPAPNILARALVDEASRKAGLVWLDYEGGGQPRPAWHVWRDGAAYVVTGGDEQHLPGLADASTVTVVVPSKDSRARVVTWRAEASVVTPAEADWQPAVTALAAGRLNEPEARTAAERWATGATVIRLRPTGEVVESPGHQPDASHATAPRETTATTLGRQPWMLGGKRRATDRNAH